MKETILGAMSLSMDYGQYRLLIDSLVKAGKTTGPNQTEALAKYTKLNAARMRRWEKTYVTSAAFEKQAKQVRLDETWLVITEAWCGDAAQSIPLIAKMAGLLENVSLRFVLRDEHPSLMDLHLTNGARSIPKLIRLNKNLDVVGTWGPRPAALQEIVLENKRDPTVPAAEFSERVQTWYNANKGADIEQEFIALLTITNQVQLSEN
jgi:hypothetical protein